MSDLQAKYQKLAAEYSKIRAQIPVLKKAVLDEQGASEEFKEAIKSKDQSIRKYEQEVDSLTFRNQQLEQRVSVLQKELEQVQPIHGKKQKEKKASVATNSIQSFEVIDEELKLKIEENMKLHRQVTELDQEHHKEMSLMRERLKEVESDMAKHQSDLENYKSHHQGEIEKLTIQKEELEVDMRTQEYEKLKILEKVQALEREISSVTDNLSKKLDCANKTINQKLPFNDTADESLNSLNIRCHRIQSHDRSRGLLKQANQLSEASLESFKNLLGHIEVKINALSSNYDFVGAANDLRQFLQRLSESESVLQPLTDSILKCRKLLDEGSFIQLITPSHLLNLSETIDNFVNYTKQIISCELQCLEIESNQPSCTEMLSARISDLQRSFVQFASTLTEVHEILSILLTNNNLESSARHKQLMQLSQAFMTWLESCKELVRSHSSKTMLEHQLPTCGVNLKMADERINNSLADLVECVSKMSLFLSSNIQCISDLFDSMFSSVHPCLSALRTKAIKYRETITRATPESVPMTIAIQNRKLIECFAQNKNDLSQQVLQLQERLNKAEQEKDHWNLEAQLMAMKYKKEVEKYNALTKNGDVLGNRANHSDDPRTSGMALKSELGSLEVVGEPGEDPDWIMTREKIVSDHYDKRMNELISSLQLADSKALYFHSECRALHKQLTACLKERDRLLVELNATNQSLATLRDELQTTSRSYEGQLSLMSEHLAGMNEKLTNQKDEIDALKYQLIQQNQGNRMLLRRGK